MQITNMHFLNRPISQNIRGMSNVKISIKSTFLGSNKAKFFISKLSESPDLFPNLTY